MGDFMCFEETNTQWPDTLSGVCQYGPGPVAKKGFLLQYTFRAGCRREQRSHTVRHPALPVQRLAPSPTPPPMMRISFPSKSSML